MELSKFLGQSNHQLDDTVLPLNGVWTRRFNLYCNSFSIRDQIVTWPQWNIELAGNGVIRIVCSASRRSCRVQTWLTRSLFFLLSLSLSLSLSFIFPLLFFSYCLGSLRKTRVEIFEQRETKGRDTTRRRTCIILDESIFSHRTRVYPATGLKWPSNLEIVRFRFRRVSRSFNEENRWFPRFKHVLQRRVDAVLNSECCSLSIVSKLPLLIISFSIKCKPRA